MYLVDRLGRSDTGHSTVFSQFGILTEDTIHKIPHGLATSNEIVCPPWSGELLSGAASDFFDGSYALYALYDEKTPEFDRALAKNWSYTKNTEMDGLAT